MARKISTPALAAMLFTAATLGLRAAVAARERRRLLREGRIRLLEHRWWHVDGLRLHARVAEPASPRYPTPVVMVHGWGISGGYFLPTAERLAADFRIYLPDLPGHGASDTPRTPQNVADLARALVAWMSAAGIERAALVGHSMGCQVAIEAALRHPERVDRLVLMGPTPDPAARDVVAQFARFLAGSIHEHWAINRHMIRDYLRMGRRLVPEFRAMLEDPIEEKLPRLTLPVLLVRGEKDTMAPQAWFARAAGLVGTTRSAVVPGGGHAAHFSLPRPLTEAIRPFLAETRPAAGRP